ncbi:thiamine phosphate synthase [uncultured Maribacter sp.]|uniref:thiamine phosphate synthase n=1 Tax=uncultured Maribacter sp. TaxID=431308 RepID=UPI002624BEA7|nr:thiamine phosphate synthase [uncultured Maribacter sp.]
MIVLIAPEKDVPNEIEILHQLFHEGLQYYHLRKPNKNYEEHCAYLNQIDKKYHHRIVVHYFHELINDFNLKGIHFQEQKRRYVLSKEYKVQSIKSFIESYAKKLNTQYSVLSTKSFSSSFHEPEDLETCYFEFDYHLLSPVFSSISKQGYEGRGFDVNNIDKRIVGMGGVTTENLVEFDKLGFKGVGVLGGIWNSSEPLKEFKKMKRYFE